MHPVRPLPRTGEVFLDSRRPDRALRISWHTEAGLVVLSLWRGNVCTTTFQLGIDEVPDLIEVLRTGLDQAYDEVLGRRREPLGGAPLTDAG